MADTTLPSYRSADGGQTAAQDAILQEAMNRVDVALNQRLAMGPERADGLDQANRILWQLRREVGGETEEATVPRSDEAAGIWADDGREVN